MRRQPASPNNRESRIKMGAPVAELCRLYLALWQAEHLGLAVGAALGLLHGNHLVPEVVVAVLLEQGNNFVVVLGVERLDVAREHEEADLELVRDNGPFVARCAGGIVKVGLGAKVDDPVGSTAGRAAKEEDLKLAGLRLVGDGGVASDVVDGTVGALVGVGIDDADTAVVGEDGVVGRGAPGTLLKAVGLKGVLVHLVPAAQVRREVDRRDGVDGEAKRPGLGSGGKSGEGNERKDTHGSDEDGKCAGDRPWAASGTQPNGACAPKNNALRSNAHSQGSSSPYLLFWNVMDLNSAPKWPGRRSRGDAHAELLRQTHAHEVRGNRAPESWRRRREPRTQKNVRVCLGVCACGSTYTRYVGWCAGCSWGEKGGV
eukprot:m.85914 g.85914  ORF g.85914 m.85914 type:complete len:373 (-) comp8412_c0_seq1:2168-3286(-)